MITPNGSLTTARQLETELRRQIVSMQLTPGMKLSEQDIAVRFSVSRQPVREAFIALAKAELLVIQPQRGTTIVKISASKVMQARFIREQIEAGVVRKLSQSGLGSLFQDDLANLVEAQSQALNKNDVPSFKQLDEQFHETLARAASLELAWRTIGDIKSHLDRACYMSLLDAAAMKPLVRQHRDILDAIIARDPDKAEAALRAHLTEILASLPAIMARHVDLFDQDVPL